MKRTLAGATAFAVAAVVLAITLPFSSYSAGSAAQAQTLPVVTGPDRPHPAVVVPPASSWTVKQGDTLSGIAQARYGSQAAWPLIFWANHKHVKWANQIQIGQVLNLPTDEKIPAAPKLLEPAPPAPQRALVSSSTGYHRSYHRTYTASGMYSGSGSMERCIISRESGGNSQVMNSSGHYGLYQFSASTWAASGGSSADFGHASVGEQQRVFHTAVAARGYSDWSPYDGC